MRIAQVCATFPPYCGGTGNVCYYQARELMRCGFDVEVFTRAIAGVAANEGRERYGIHRLRPLLSYGNAAYLPSLLGCLKGFDVIHLHYPFYGGEIAALAARLNSIPLVITYHQDVLMNGLMGWLEASLRFTLERATLRWAKRVMFTSMDYYQNSRGRKLLNGREWVVREVPNGVDVKLFQPRRRDLRGEGRFPLSGDPFVVILVAALDRAHAFKGIDVFLQALGCLPEQVVGVVVGEGELRRKYEQLAKRYGIEGRVSFTGKVQEDELVGCYNAADVTVLPSTHRGEAFGLVLLESMACGTPVIASNLPGVRMVVEDGVDGFLVEPNQAGKLAEKMLILKEDRQLRARMGARGREKVVERYSWEKVTEFLVNTYSEAVVIP